MYHPSFLHVGGGCAQSHGRRLFNVARTHGWKPAAWVPTILDSEFRECEPVAAQLGCPLFWSVDEALDAVEPEIVVVATPNQAHYAQVKSCLLRGVPVLCEKPFTRTLSQAEELTALSRERNVPVFINYSYTGFRSLSLLRKLVAGGDLGVLKGFQISFMQNWLRLRDGEWRVDPVRAGELGALIDIGTHLHDLLDYTTGSRVTAVTCRSMNQDRFPVIVDAELEVVLENGTSGTLAVSQIAEPENQIALRLVTDRGDIEWNNGAPEDLRIHCDGRPEQTHHSGSSYPAMPIVLSRCSRYIRRWKQSGEFPGNTRCRTARHGLEGLKFLDACERAWRSGALEPVDPPVDDLPAASESLVVAATA